MSVPSVPVSVSPPAAEPVAAAPSSVVTVNYFAAARAAAGASTETVHPGTLRELITDAGERHGPALAKVLGVCSFLVDGVRLSDHDAALPPGSSVDVLPPFAGG